MNSAIATRAPMRSAEERTNAQLPDSLRSASTRGRIALPGYAGTNVNLVAREAGISVGSLYQYFRTKQNIILALIEHSHRLLAGIIDDIFAAEPAFFPRAREILRRAVDSSRKDPEMLNLLIACTTEELASLPRGTGGWSTTPGNGRRFAPMPMRRSLPSASTLSS